MDSSSVREFIEVREEFSKLRDAQQESVARERVNAEARKHHQLRLEGLLFSLDERLSELSEKADTRSERVDAEVTNSVRQWAEITHLTAAQKKTEKLKDNAFRVVFGALWTGVVATCAWLIKQFWSGS